MLSLVAKSPQIYQHRPHVSKTLDQTSVHAPIESCHYHITIWRRLNATQSQNLLLMDALSTSDAPPHSLQKLPEHSYAHTTPSKSSVPKPYHPATQKMLLIFHGKSRHMGELRRTSARVSLGKEMKEVGIAAEY